MPHQCEYQRRNAAGNHRDKIAKRLSTKLHAPADHCVRNNLAPQASETAKPTPSDFNQALFIEEICNKRGRQHQERECREVDENYDAKTCEICRSVTSSC